MPITKLDALRHNLNEVRSQDPPPSYQTIGDMYEVNKTVIWRVMNTDYEPKDPVIRARLGLPTSATFILMDEVEAHNHSLLGNSDKQCECGCRFIPNVPWRKWCFYCRPIK